MSDSPEKSPAPAGDDTSTVDLSKLERHDDRHREAYRLRRSGRKVADIAALFGVDVRTIHRWIETYCESYRKAIEETPSVNLIAEEIARLEDVEQTARERAAETKSDTQRRGFLTVALKAIRARHALLLDVGVLPREPTKIFTAIHELKSRMGSQSPESDRSADDIRDDILRLLKHSRRMDGSL